MKKYFAGYSFHTGMLYAGTALLLLIGIAVFFSFHQWTAAFLVTGVFLLLLSEVLHFVVIDGECISEWKYLKKKKEIPIKEINGAAVTKKGKEAVLCIYGENDFFETAYQKNMLKKILLLCDVPEKQAMDFLENDKSFENEEIKLIAEPVKIDGLFLKKTFVNRKIARKKNDT